MVQRQVGKLTLTLPSDREIDMTRVFDAPREMVFEAHSKCEHLEKWWGPRKYTLAVCELDFRPGGAYRFVQRGPDGEEHGFRGEFARSCRRSGSSGRSNMKACPDTCPSIL